MFLLALSWFPHELTKRNHEIGIIACLSQPRTLSFGRKFASQYVLTFEKKGWVSRILKTSSDPRKGKIRLWKDNYTQSVNDHSANGCL